MRPAGNSDRASSVALVASAPTAIMGTANKSAIKRAMNFGVVCVFIFVVISFGPTTRITVAGPSVFGMKLERDPGVRCIRLGPCLHVNHSWSGEIALRISVVILFASRTADLSAG